METLAALVERDGPLNELDAVGWVIRLAKRLEELHRLGVAHGGVGDELRLVGAEGEQCDPLQVLGVAQLNF